MFSCRGIEICVDWFRARGHKEITVFVPKWRKEATRPDNPVMDRDVLERLERERVLVYTPSRLLGGKRLVCYDDRYVLKLAADTDGIVVSNDNYRDLAAEKAEFRRVVDRRLLMYSFVNDRFMPPDDPLGRSGPTLDTFLRAPCRTALPPACPYGRKCTYGNKCKFHHPERAGRPHKSVAEKLTERARAMRARDLHNTVSLPPAVRPADIKKPLARAQSAAPRLADHALATLSAAPRLADHALATHFERAQMTAPTAGPSHDTNPHRKLARQLTLNPACDPRLQAHRAAARVASAPASALQPPYLPAAPPAPCSSEGALLHWEARSRMHYHLTGIFPESQVAEAMAAYPSETDAQTMCAIILAKYRPNEAGGARLVR